jgi:hypothetical protein
VLLQHVCDVLNSWAVLSWVSVEEKLLCLDCGLDAAPYHFW